MSFENLEQDFANSTGFILDRTVEPPIVLGQAFIISKNRAAACASSLFNYIEAPWAVAINFPHPDLALGVRGITLHPDFDVKLAQSKYLSQAGLPEQFGNTQLNDLATIVLDNQILPLPTDRVAKLNNVLTLPLPTADIEASGVINGDNFLSIVTSVVDAGKTGLLALYAGRNLPFAYIQYETGSIKRVYFNKLYNEMAFSELLFARPAGNFTFQSQDNLKWDGVRAINIFPANLITEAKRRVYEVMSLLDKIGGRYARYQKTTQQFNVATITNANWHKLVERLWQAIDGYITVEKLGQKVGVDTYSILQGLRELINYGAISLLNRESPFDCGKELGHPILSHMDFDINSGDPLAAFYLNPLSGAPVWHQGHFSGVASVLQSKNLLHSIPMDNNVPGALILKNNKLIGVHNGPVPPKTGTLQSSEKLSQMMWVGALLDMGARREQGDNVVTSSLTGLRSWVPVEKVEAATNLEKYICPACYSTNTQTGPCFNCGTMVETPASELPKATLAQKYALSSMEDFTQRYGITQKHLFVFAFVVLSAIFITVLLYPEEQPNQQASTPSSFIAHHNSLKAESLAVQEAGFRSAVPPGYWYEDTFDSTKPSKSFGLYSQTGNQKILFVLFDDLAPIMAFSDFLRRPLFSGATGPTTVGLDPKVDEGVQMLGTSALRWYIGRYNTEADPAHPIFIASFPAKIPAKSFLVIAQAYENGVSYDFKSTLWLIDNMAQEFTAASKKQQEDTTAKNNPEEKPFATEEDLKAYCGKLQEKLQANLTLPEKAEAELKKEQSKKLKAMLTLGIDHEGNVKKLEFIEPSEWESVNNALLKDINKLAPYTDLPKVKEELLRVLVSLRKDKISVNLP